MEIEIEGNPSSKDKIETEDNYLPTKHEPQTKKKQKKNVYIGFVEESEEIMWRSDDFLQTVIQI